MMKIVLTPHFDLLNATYITTYIVIKANTEILTSVLLFLYALMLQECFCRPAKTVKHRVCISALSCLSHTGAVQWNFWHLQNFCCYRVWSRAFSTGRSLRKTRPGSGLSLFWDLRMHLGARSKPARNWSELGSQESYLAWDFSLSFCLILSMIWKTNSLIEWDHCDE